MKILTVIPIAKGIPRDELSYFSAKEIPLGTLVTAPFGNRSIKAVVVDQQPVRDLKGSIKSSNFALRNITTIHSDTTLPHGIFYAAQKTSEYYVARIGPLLETMLPQTVFNYYIEHPTHLIDKRITNPNIQAVQVTYEERVSLYKTIVRENLAKHVSTMITVPSVAHAEHLADRISTGISEKLFVLHSKKTKKYLEESTKIILEQKHPSVVIVTAPFTSLARNDWDTIIIEESSSPYYRYSFGPIFDMRFFIEQFAKYSGSRLIYADTLLDLAIQLRIAKREILDMRMTWHITKPEDFQIIDLKLKPTNPQLVKRRFSLLHPTTQEKISEALSRQFSVLLLTTRKGLAPLTICSDCGTAVTCPHCGSPLVLHRKKGGSTEHEIRTYMCHHCTYVTPPIDQCAACASWKLTMLGVSTESLRDETESVFPTSTVFVCDGDSSTPAGINKTIKTWNTMKNSILIATPMILPYLDKVDFGCIVSMDSLLSLPTYSGSEYGLHTALHFLEKNTHSAIIQTRSIDHDVITAIKNENIFEFIKNETESRTQFDYPPSKILIKISSDVSQDRAVETTKSLEQLFQIWSPDILAKRSKKIGYITLHVILKIDPDLWNDPDFSLHQLLRDMSTDSIIEINPDALF
jgi:primosomal protein N'